VENQWAFPNLNLTLISNESAPTIIRMRSPKYSLAQSPGP